MSDIIDINQLQNQFNLKEYSETLFATSVALQQQVQKLEEENTHLKELLDKAVPQFKPIPIEQLICELQIKMLHDQALGRPLTLEETKRLDLLVKNLYLAKGQATEIVDNKQLNASPDKATDEELIRVIKGM